MTWLLRGKASENGGSNHLSLVTQKGAGKVSEGALFCPAPKMKGATSLEVAFLHFIGSDLGVLARRAPVSGGRDRPWPYSCYAQTCLAGADDDGIYRFGHRVLTSDARMYIRLDQFLTVILFTLPVCRRYRRTYKAEICTLGFLT
jgi:hypothetical protein